MKMTSIYSYIHLNAYTLIYSCKINKFTQLQNLNVSTAVPQRRLEPLLNVTRQNNANTPSYNMRAQYPQIKKFLQFELSKNNPLKYLSNGTVYKWYHFSYAVEVVCTL